MDRSAIVAGSTFSDNLTSGDSKRKDTFLSRCTEIYESKYWTPLALRAPVLILTIVICWSLIGVLEYLLWKSQRDSGLIFAPVISALPLRDTFLYLYFPTIVAVLFSIYWAWIDLETKRMEPYYQLSKENGALGKDSLLLQYPFSFLPFVPIRAFKEKHWPVFWASFAVVLVTWGLVPTQAGIFSVKTVTRTTNMTFAVSTSTMPFEKQATSLTYRYLQSTYGIAALNETLPAYMTREYMLAPFQPSNSTPGSIDGPGNHTAPTTMYQMTLTCEDVSRRGKVLNRSEILIYNSSNGCNCTTGLDGNLTAGQFSDQTRILDVKEYNGRYVGFHNGGMADWYLSPDCPSTANTTFFAAFEKSKTRAADPPGDVTAIFCQTHYWRQQVSATVDKITKEPLKTEPLALKESLPWNVFNATDFEALLNSGSLGIKVRADVLPTANIPRYLETVATTNLSLITGNGGTLPSMVGLALATGSRPMEDYLDWKNMSEAYSAAYQLLFARAMVDVLDYNVPLSIPVEGRQDITSQAVVLEPLFVHLVVGFLSMVSIATIALLLLSLIYKRNLRTDPSTIASIMAMVADNRNLLLDFADLDCCTVEDTEKSLAQRRFKLVNGDGGTNLLEIGHTNIVAHGDVLFDAAGSRQDSPSSIAKPVRPVEFSLWMACLLVSLFLTLVVTLGIVFIKARTSGLPLPSSNAIVQNILENYIPTAIATLIEPLWILINRLLCMLQPLEELQDCNAIAKRSIDLNYSSLPPQLVVFKALKSRHFVLAAVCTMALLANVLAVALSGLFNQDSFDIRHETTFQPPYQYKFVSINGTVGPSNKTPLDPSGAFHGGDGEDQFLVAESNLTRNTPLPSWTDEAMFYRPIFAESTYSMHTNSSYFEATTDALGAELDCVQLKLGQGFNASVAYDSHELLMSMNVTVPWNTGNVQCSMEQSIFTSTITHGPSGEDYSCVRGPRGNEMVSLLQARENATQSEHEACAGKAVFVWMRHPEGSCGFGNNTRLDEQRSLFVQCQPRLVTGKANIQVDAGGRLVRPVQDFNMTQHAPQNLFSNDPSNVVRQSNLYLFKASGSLFHNDTFATDYFNYFIKRATNNSRLLDPKLPVPTFKDAAEPLSKTYSKLFAIWLGINKKNLFVPVVAASEASIQGHRVQSEPRVFVSTTMFIIAEAILCTYVLVTIWVYARRPGQYLARLPTSIASQIALFAASAAVEDMQGTSHLDQKGRAQHLQRLDSRYGFGSFIGGGDGRVHIGIEKMPLVMKPRVKTGTWLEQKLPLLRRRSWGRGS